MIGMGAKQVTVNTSSGSDGKRDASEKKLFKLFSTLREVLTDPDVKAKAQDGLTAFVFGVIPSVSERILEVSQDEEQKKSLLETTKDFTGYQGETPEMSKETAPKGIGMGQEIPSMKLPENPAKEVETPGMSQASGNEDLDAMMKQLEGNPSPNPVPQEQAPVPPNEM